MGIGAVFLCVAIGLVIVYGAISIAPHFLCRRDRKGDSSKGVVIFAESTRWLGVSWGKRSVAAGLRRAGFEGKFIYWKFHSTWRACLVVPVIGAAKLLERESNRLAEFIIDRRRSRSGPVYLMGYSAGGYVATRALELLPEDVTVDAVALLAPAFSPGRDMACAVGRTRPGKFIVSSSLCDWLIVGMGTLLCGTCDRKHTLSAGTLGCRGGGSEGITQLRWRPAMMKTGNVGGHFAASAAGYVAAYIAPAMFGDQPVS